VAHYAVSVKQPVVPAPAATLVLLRDRPAGSVEVLLMQRHHKSKFAAGDFVFPGGKLEADDNPDDAVRWCAGLDLATAARTLALEDAPSTALGYWIGAIRETFEEAGILLATREDGGPVRLPPARVAEYRRAVQADNRAFWPMVKEEKLRLATDTLVYFAHWITPVDMPLRFDTRFFAAPMPAGQDAVGDDHEMISLRWLSPREALDAHARGELPLRNPTVRNLMLFDGAASSAEALGRLRDRVVTTIRPKVVVDASGQRRVFNPGDPGYDALP
jgi:8-oxo-dGTP pyrophosphatase MutT (NUDIX family)